MNHVGLRHKTALSWFPLAHLKPLNMRVVDALLGVWAVADDVAGGYGGVPAPRVFEHRFEGGEVAVYVGDVRGASFCLICK